MTTIHNFVHKHAIKMLVDYADSNSNMAADDKWMASANHYRCVLHKGRKRLTIPFSQGIGISHEPRVADVLSCMASDASGADNSFEDWASNYGYDLDSRKAERTFRTIQRQSQKLQDFLGIEAFKELLYSTEQL